MNVTNSNESAYEAQLVVEHHKSVTYIGASKESVFCNRFNKTIVLCSLGNPMSGNSEVSVTLRFDANDLEESIPELQFTIYANSTSKQLMAVDPTVLYVSVVKEAELSIKG